MILLIDEVSLSDTKSLEIEKSNESNWKYIIRYLLQQPLRLVLERDCIFQNRSILISRPEIFLQKAILKIFVKLRENTSAGVYF